MRKTIFTLALATATATLAACSAVGTVPAPPPRPSTSSPAAQPVPEANTPTLAGPVAVDSLPYGLPGTTGYQTSVSFHVVNPSDFPMVSRFRVTTTAADGKTVNVTDGSDQVALAPHQTLLVVNEPQGVQGTAPKSAKVQFYPNAAGQMVLPDPGGWKVTNISPPNCNSGFVGCQVTADLTYEGAPSPDMQLRVSGVSVAFAQGGTVVLAGNLAQSGGSTNLLIAGQPVPVSGYLNGKAVGDTSSPEFGVQVVPPAM